ncbi:MAG: UDP-glucose 4-epimerase GalE, partial [Candidatus Brocadiia bacterium]|nr:UDP-glucose 4-epimerase GalE [Candidatus Brocadiia bacterium]
IHVSDLAAIHVAALEDLAVNGENRVLNCGYGHGHSVAEVVAAVKEVSGADFLVRLAERRAGDPPALVADATRLRRLYGWKPRFDDLHLIVRTAIDWERSLAARDAG